MIPKDASQPLALSVPRPLHEVAAATSVLESAARAAALSGFQVLLAYRKRYTIEVGVIPSIRFAAPYHRRT
jgi:hypothetical protein